MGNHQCPQLVPVLLDIGHVWQHDVDPVHRLIGESQASIHQDDVVFVAEDPSVFADLPLPA
jgi:hypothetical protein